MIKQILLTSMATFVIAVACLTVILGGCGGKGRAIRSGKAEAKTSSGASCPVPAGTETVHAILGTDTSRMARLEEPVVVDATVFAADGDGPARGRVAVDAGTWLVPADAYVPPEGWVEGGGR